MSDKKTLTTNMLPLAVYVDKISSYNIVEEINVTDEILKLRLEIYKNEE